MAGGRGDRGTRDPGLPHFLTPGKPLCPPAAPRVKGAFPRIQSALSAPHSCPSLNALPALSGPPRPLSSAQLLPWLPLRTPVPSPQPPHPPRLTFATSPTRDPLSAGSAAAPRAAAERAGAARSPGVGSFGNSSLQNWHPLGEGDKAPQKPPPSAAQTVAPSPRSNSGPSQAPRVYAALHSGGLVE